ncbi:MAG: polysaccharide biosynthesis protein [Proteobacteria bacterium]|nr:polysaccharide biosynthesis protein [Pseudomonadota bacterium]
MKFRSHSLSRQRVALLHDVIMAAFSFVAALALRLGLDGVPFASPNFWVALGLFTGVCGAVFWAADLYQGIWRYASLNDMLAIVRAVTLALLIFLPITFLITRLDELPRSFLIINWLVLVFLLGAPRLLYRIFKDRGFDHVLERDRHKRVPVLLIGVGDAAEVFVREMARDRDAPYEVLGLVDEKGTRVGRRIHGVPVIGHLDDLGSLLSEVARKGRQPQRLVLTKRPTREELEQILDLAHARGMTIARLPRLTEFQSGEAERFEPRPVAIEDLLGRTQTPLDRGMMRRLIEGRRVLVTGAGGSIGAELVRQAASFGPAHMTLFDNSEYLLYSIGLELGEAHPGLSYSLVLGDVRDRARLDEIMAGEAPALVFHAAALKHVPMVEANPVEGVLTNVVGTRNTADACRKAGVAEMVLISTDKAINPSSVMGATKRLAECYCQALDIAGRRDGASGTRFVTVRFGNVLGSTGSVVPLFHRQLAAGGPLTVTHPEMTRYFMTVREAVELVLQASALGVEAPADEAGKIYVLDMGEPIKIMDLAGQIIRLAGLRPEKDIKIEVTGLRPGEKLREELFHEAELLVETTHPGLRLAAPRTTNLELLGRSLDELAELCAGERGEGVMRLLHHLVPEYHEEQTRDRAVR